MSESQNNRAVLMSMHQIFLETLRHREQEIFQYLAILGPALAGFGWLLFNSEKEKEFVCGTSGVIALLFLGAVYSLTLGYNFRYIILELAKLETVLDIKYAMLEGWPRRRQDFIKYKIFDLIPWCVPPEIIKVFWLAFLLGILWVTSIAYFLTVHFKVFIFCFGAGAFFTGFFLPIWYGLKFHKLCKKEPEKWTAHLSSLQDH